MSKDIQQMVEDLDKLISELVEERTISSVGRISLDRKIENLKRKRNKYKRKLEGGGEEE